MEFEGEFGRKQEKISDSTIWHCLSELKIENGDKEKSWDKFFVLIRY